LNEQWKIVFARNSAIPVFETPENIIAWKKFAHRQVSILLVYSKNPGKLPKQTDIIMERNSFLKTSSLVATSLLAPSLWDKLLAEIYSDNNLPGETKINIRDYFEWDNEDVIVLAENVYENCVLTKIMPPRVTLEHQWIMPGGFVGQWIWDTMFVTDLLSVIPGKETVLRDVFHNYRDFQERWNKVTPEYRHNMVACMIEPFEVVNWGNYLDWTQYPAFSQIPILAWGLEQVYKRNRDIQIVRENLDSVEKFHEWYWRERDVTDIGMVSVGSYSGDRKHARNETFDNDGTLDHLNLTRHPTRNLGGEGYWYGDILVVGNTSYLVQAEQSLVRLARIAGDEAMAKRREIRIKKSIEAVRKYMWDEESGLFLAVHRDSLKKIKETSIGCWMPLQAGIPTKAMAKRMAEVLASEAWQTPLPVPTIPQNDPRYNSGGYWRGDSWPPTTYQVIRGIKAYGFDDLAADIADKVIANAIKNGVNEHSDSQTGQGLGVGYLGMSCSLVTIMLEGLSGKYKLSVK
jgi:putative isomerase